MSSTATKATRLTVEHKAKGYFILSDLPKDDQRGQAVITVDLNNLPHGLWAIAGEMFALADAANFIVGNAYGGQAIYLNLTDDEIADRLTRANEEYDRNADRYDAAMVSGQRPEDYYDRSRIQSYCKRRGIDTPWGEAMS